MFSSKSRLRSATVSLALLGAMVAGPFVASGTASATVTRHDQRISHDQGGGGNGRGGDPTLLALGDSVAFGYVPPQLNPNYMKPNHFVSYANYVARWNHLKVVNLSCPGETTASMINPSAQSNGCENHVAQTSGGTFYNAPGGYRTLYPLHHNYSGAQLTAATAFINSHNVKVITLTIGANDVFVCQTEQNGCTTTAALGGLATTLSTNLSTIISTIQATGYHGKFVLLDYYSLNYSSPSNAGTIFFDGVIDKVAASFPGVTVASGYNAFKQASANFGGDSCAAGLLIKYPSSSGLTGCNIHPSHLGHIVLAKTIDSALGVTRVGDDTAAMGG